MTVVLAAAVPLALAAALGLYARRRRRAAARIGDAAVLRRLGAADPGAVPWLRIALVLPAGVALGGALLGPAEAAPAGERGGGRVVLVLDASSSMLAADARPHRLEVEREVARAAVRALAGAPIGIVAFAGRAYVLSPPTPDVGALELYLDALHPQIVAQTGSSLASAIRQATGLLAAGGEADGAGPGGTILLVSDGDALEPAETIRAAAQRAADAGVRILAVGVGTPAGAPVPDVDFATGRQLGYQREPDGSPAVSRLRPDLLRDAARRTGGAYVDASDGRALGRLLARLPALAAGTDAGARAAGWPVWLAGLALLLLATDALLTTRAAGD